MGASGRNHLVGQHRPSGHRSMSRFASQISIWIRLTSICLLFAASIDLASAQNQRSINLVLCNGGSGISPERQVAGCSALIELGADAEMLAKIYNNRGNSYAKQGNLCQGRAGLRSGPGNAAGLRDRFEKSRRRVLQRRRLRSGACRPQRGSQGSPQNADVLAHRAQVFSAKQDYRLALADYDEAIRLDQKRAALWNARCWNWAAIGDLQAALSDCNEAIKLSPGSASAMDSRGLTHLKMGQWNAALSDFAAALRLDLKLASALYGRGLARQKLGRAGPARADINAATALNPNIAKEFERLGL